ncbi:hypothetical protein [Pseudomonas botevensis]|uniref:hypothetical protein n=1 Tax=Pseudomonas botevensis TaxID=2842352 RepID=UPI001C3C7A8F|nr:hypothetical protein [Pseudomonas botevensis]MBV4472775.1 hypothetical protein [Pseudomonas botevensis]
MTYTGYFKVAVWMPAIFLPFLLVLDAFYFSKPLSGGIEQFILVYILGFGLAAYIPFAAFSSRVISNRTKSEVIRLAWWAPVLFIPFYGAPWVLYGAGCLVAGRSAGLGMMFMWLAYIPYFLFFGVLLSAIAVFAFKLMDSFSLFSDRR